MVNARRSVLGRVLQAITQPLALVVLDCLVFFLIARAVFWIRLDFSPELIDGYLLGVALFTIFLKFLFDCYPPPYSRAPIQSVGYGLIAVVVAGGILASGLYVFRPPLDIAIFWRGNLPLVMTIFALFTMASQATFGALSQSQSAQSRWYFLGSMEKFDSIVKRLKTAPRSIRVAKLPIEDVRTLKLRESHADNQLIVEDDYLVEEDLEAILELQKLGVRVMNYSDFVSYHFKAIPLDGIPTSAVIDPASYFRLSSRYYLKPKRVFDLIIALSLLFILSPLMILTYSYIVLSAGRPGLYTQVRTGLFGRKFTLYKFRTMIPLADYSGTYWTHNGDNRVLPRAKWLRKLRLDELPQLINVIKGEMSLIGPRPELSELTREYRSVLPLFSLRELLRPGLSGWAQVEQGYASGFEESKTKLEYDLYYLKNISPWLDSVIFFKTLRAIIWGAGR